MCDCGGDCGCSQPKPNVQVEIISPDAPPPPVEVRLSLDKNSAIWLMGVCGQLASGNDEPQIYSALSQGLENSGHLFRHPAYLRGKNRVINAPRPGR